MQTSYPVRWRSGDREDAAGTMQLERHGVVIHGDGETFEVPFDRIAHVAVRDEEGRNALVVERRAEEPLTITLVPRGSGADQMLDALLTLKALAAHRRRVVVVAPLKPGAHEAAGELLESGPPFDPAEVQTLQHHDVLLGLHEAIFLFEFSDDSAAFAALIAEPSLLLGAAGWNDLLAGPPRVADVAFSWSRTEPPNEDAAYLPTPGPGDSEGGDIY